MTKRFGNVIKIRKKLKSNSGDIRLLVVGDLKTISVNACVKKIVKILSS